MSKLVCFCASLIFILNLSTKPVFAHVLLKDESGKTGAVLHINPDDDPIAGGHSSFFFDIQDSSLSSSDPTAVLVVTNEDGLSENVPLDFVGNTVSVAYIFPKRGVYTLQLTVSGASSELVFNHTQRVSRGLAGSPLDEPRRDWAEALFVGVICGALALSVVALNRKEKIAMYSKW
jgi:hypothetical protein